MTKITMDGKYQTRGGRPVRVLCVDAEGSQPVVALVVNDVQRFKADGSFYHDSARASSYDLIPVPEKRRVKFWVNVYPSAVGANFDSKKEADIERRTTCIACLEIDREFMVGEGL